MAIVTALVSWPSAPLTRHLVLAALKVLEQDVDILESANHKHFERLIQWSTYDVIDHELTNAHRDSVLASSYTFRKALIRKHYLAHSVHAYLTKNPASVLHTALPRTYVLDLAFADELDEKWADELYDLNCLFENEPEKWWILKPGMADRGMGVRLFNTKEALQQIFQDFELIESQDEEDCFLSENETTGVSKTTVAISQLRYFVIQEYILSPLLIDPRETQLNGTCQANLKLQGHKFHLRAYCVASGALQLYLYDRILALFCLEPYSRPGTGEEGSEELYPSDLEAQLSNTSLQIGRGEEGVRLFDELVECQVLDENDNPAMIFTESNRQDIIHQIVSILAETFRAALQIPVHFQPLENAFEIYGVDFLVEYVPTDISPKLQVKLMEVNAEPAIELTGPRLKWILEDLFASVAKVCVYPFITNKSVSNIYGKWDIGEAKEHLIKCLNEAVRGV